MKYILIKAINGFADILFLILFARAILSWIVGSMNDEFYRIYEKLCDFTDPLIAPFRNASVRIGNSYVDLSIILAFLSISILRKFIVYVILIVL